MTKPTVNISLDENLTLDKFKEKIRVAMDFPKRWEFLRDANKETTLLDIAEVASEYVKFDIPQLEMILKFEEMDSVDLSILFSTLYEEGWGDELENIWGMLDNVDTFECEVEIYIKRKQNNSIAKIPIDHIICNEYMKTNPGVSFLTWVLNKYPERYEEIKEKWETKKQNILLSK